ncbi:MAG: sugar phosphate isomerase/epimerase [Burkholderiales bacterium]|nr:sugar phosphate isomerase/epimerase [Phycisphaerae bacterium]
MPGPLDFGVQSYCFREFKDNATVAQKVKQIGLDKIEVCGVHADFSKPEAFGDVVKTYKDAGISVISIGVQTFTGADNEEAWFQCAQAAGAKHISAHFQIGSYQTAIKKTSALCRKYGIKVGIHCHGGYMFGGSPDVLEHLIGLGEGEIGLCIDTAWCIQIGPWQGQPVKWAEKFAGKIFGVHYKDFTFDRNAQWHDVVVGTGNLDLPAFVKALQNGGFDGMSVIEYEADPKDPVPALTKCVQQMRTVTI